MSETQPDPAKDALGLDIASLKLDDVAAATAGTHDAPAEPQSASDAASPQAEGGPAADAQSPTAGDDEKKQPVRERKKPYINPERVKTGGPQRVRPV